MNLSNISGFSNPNFLILEESHNLIKPATKTPFGIDLSRESTASTFATCVSCFDYALSREADDWQALRLSVIRLRLTRWGEAVNIYSDPLLGHLNLILKKLRTPREF